jgi:hypothetical protein
MQYWIISKIELIEGTENLQFTEVGYTEDESVATEINEDYDSTFGKFSGENRTKLEIGQVLISSFFATTPYVNEARTIVDNVDELNIPQINSKSEL